MVKKRGHIAPILAVIMLSCVITFLQSPLAFGEPLDRERTIVSEVSPEQTEQTEPEQRVGGDSRTMTEAPPEQRGQETPKATSAEETKKEPAESSETDPSEEEGITDAVHATISRGVLATAEWLDSFFDDERFAAEDNRTRIKLRIDTFFEDEAPVDVKTKMRLQLSLPRLKRKGRLLITGDPDEGTGEPGTPGETIPDQATGDETRDMTASVLYDHKATVKRNARLRAGVRYRDGSPVVFVAPRYRRLFKLEPWAFRFTQEVPWYTDIGWQSKTRFDLERQFRNKLFFRTTADGFWTEEANGYFYGLSFYLRQPLSTRRALEYEWNNYFHTRPENKLEELVLRVRFRQKIWRDWLFYELAPQCRFSRERDFAMVPGILFRIEVVFGRVKREKG